MKRIAVAFLLVVSSVSLGAQSGGTSYGLAGIGGLEQNANGSNQIPKRFRLQNPQRFKLQHVGEAAGTTPVCPVGMRATQSVWDRTRKIRGFDEGITKSPFGQRILLTLIDARPARILSATVLVHGLNGKNHMVQTAGAHGPNATKMLHVSFAKQEDGSAHGDLYVPGFTSVSAIELQQVSYADGSTWRISTTNVCRVTPDPMMLIAEH